MRDRAEQIIRGICVILAALVLAELVRAGFRARPLAGVMIPAVPVLETNAPAAPKPMAAAKPSAAHSLTNGMPGANTNSINSMKVTAGPAPLVASNVTMAAVHPGTNVNLSGHAGTNLVVTNTLAIQGAGSVTNQTNSAGAGHIKHVGKRRMPMGMPGGMNGFMMGGMPGGAPPPPLPTAIQSRVDQIVNSEIFAPVAHPLPMALLGIAGDTAFLRTDDGQTGLVKVGDSLGNVKLLRIGVNRVLVEQDGQSKELTIFDGYGGDSLLTKENKDSK